MNKIKRFDERKVKQTIPLENQIEVSEPLTEEKLNKLQNQVTFLEQK